MLAEIGDDNITFQVLTNNVASVNNGKKDSKIAFFTDLGKGHDLANAVACDQKPKFTALIVWFPTAEMERVVPPPDQRPKPKTETHDEMP